jgi:hypothetical protein
MFFIGYIQINSFVTTYLLLAQTLNGFRFGEPHTNRSPPF